MCYLMISVDEDTMYAIWGLEYMEQVAVGTVVAPELSPCPNTCGLR